MASPFNILPGQGHTDGLVPGQAPRNEGASTTSCGGEVRQGELHPRPAWLKVRFFGGENYQELKRIMRTLQLHTVCESARCPNQGECWEHRTATFMILGDICTRVAQAIEQMNLKYAVVTSVNRDDQADGGSKIFARTIAAIRARAADCRIEVLIPDFRGDGAALETVVAARPDVLNHNMETVPRLYRHVRPGAIYARSLDLLANAKRLAPSMPVKTGMMLGLGESREEVLQAMSELAAQGTDILTLGQYLQPTREHLPVVRFVHPQEFAEYKQLGQQMGFRHVESGPLVRSSYHAFEQEQAAQR
jgi:lipoic acid synthetase